MPSLSMCSDSKCPARVACYRYRARPSEYQSYTDFPRNGRNRCESWEPIFDDSKMRPIHEIEPDPNPPT